MNRRNFLGAAVAALFAPLAATRAAYALSTAGLTVTLPTSPTVGDTLLIDYEEGTWEPTLTLEGEGAFTYSGAGRYIRVGDVVTFSGFVGGYVVSGVQRAGRLAIDIKCP